MDRQEILLLVVLIGLIIARVIFDRSIRDIAIKRKVQLGFFGAICFLFLGFAVSQGAPLAVLLFLIPVLAILGVIMWRYLVYCPQCGSSVYNPNWFKRMTHCPYCGAKL